MLKYIIIIFLIIISTGSLFGEEWKIEQKQVNFGCDCQMYASEILIALKGACSGSDFTETEKGRIEHNNNRSTYVLSSWQEFVDFKGKYFESSFFDIFRESYFYHNRLVVVDVSYTGSRFIKNEKLYQTDRECGFSYEIWDRKVHGDVHKTIN